MTKRLPAGWNSPAYAREDALARRFRILDEIERYAQVAGVSSQRWSDAPRIQELWAEYDEAAK